MLEHLVLNRQKHNFKIDPLGMTMNGEFALSHFPTFTPSHFLTFSRYDSPASQP